jgi:hypothetical protein
MEGLWKMPMDFLRRIENATFPLAIQAEAEIRCAAPGRAPLERQAAFSCFA